MSIQVRAGLFTATDGHELAGYRVVPEGAARDELLLEAGSLTVHAAYRDNDVDYRLVRPGDRGLPRIGHSKYFRPSAEAAQWPPVAEWLATRSSATRARHANEM